MGVEHLNSVELSLLGDTIGLGSDSTGDVGTVTVTIGAAAVASVVGEEGGTTLKLRVAGRNTSVNHVGASSGTSAAVVGVRGATTAGVRDTSKTPSGGGLCDVGLLLDLNLTEVGLNDGILLNVVNLFLMSLIAIQLGGLLTPGKLRSRLTMSSVISAAKPPQAPNL